MFRSRKFAFAVKVCDLSQAKVQGLSNVSALLGNYANHFVVLESMIIKVV